MTFQRQSQGRNIGSQLSRPGLTCFSQEARADVGVEANVSWQALPSVWRIAPWLWLCPLNSHKIENWGKKQL